MVVATSATTVLAATTSIVDRATTLAATLSDRDVDEVVKALYSVSEPPPIKMVEIEKPAFEMPAEAPYVYYAGTDAHGNAVIWKATAAIKMATADSARTQEAGDEFVSAYIAASVMQGRIGAHWRAVFTSDPGPRVYARAFVIAWETKVALIAATSRTNIAWADATFHPGMPRAQVYDFLRSRDLVAWYASGGLPGSGCEVTATNPNRPWPVADPKMPPACANPAVTVEYTVGANFACGTEIDQGFIFDAEDRLTSVVDSKEHTTCL